MHRASLPWKHYVISSSAPRGSRRAHLSAALNNELHRHIAETYLAHHGETTCGGSSADRVQVVVHIDQAILSEHPEGKRVAENGLKCFRGNVWPPKRPSRCSFEDSLRDYLHKHDPGLAITAETGRCQWRGESMDYSMAIESMQFLEHKAAVAEPVL